MTIPAFAEELGGRLPSALERTAANQLRRILASHATGETTLRIIDDQTKEPSEITLTPGLSKLLHSTRDVTSRPSGQCGFA
jgi:hypothetical protein